MHEFRQNNKYELCGIVWYEDETAISGHYRSNMKIDDRRFFINDTDLKSWFEIVQTTHQNGSLHSSL